MTKPSTEARRHGERSGNREIGKSGDRKGEFTAETRRRGENQKPTTEARRHGERSGDLVIAHDRVIGLAAGSDQSAKVEQAIYLCHPERAGADATASRRTPAKTGPELAVSGSSHKTLKDALVAAFQTIRAMLSEIFDESAYNRFLLRTHASRSIASYRAFTRERDAAMLKKPRCC
jgi:hypothetical protein